MSAKDRARARIGSSGCRYVSGCLWCVGVCVGFIMHRELANKRQQQRERESWQKQLQAC